MDVPTQKGKKKTAKTNYSFSLRMRSSPITFPFRRPKILEVTSDTSNLHYSQFLPKFGGIKASPWKIC